MSPLNSVSVHAAKRGDSAILLFPVLNSLNALLHGKLTKASKNNLTS